MQVSKLDGSYHLDLCRPCGVVWLDRGELDLVQIQYEKEIDGRTPEDWARIERMAVAELRLKQGLERERQEVEAGMRTVVNALDCGTPGIAAAATAWASRNLSDGLWEQDAARRRDAILKAAIGFAIAAAVVVVWYLLS